MMGFGAMSMAGWMVGTIALATIWGGLCWLLAALGHRPAQLPPGIRTDTGGDPPLLSTGTWQQPAFGPPVAARPTADDHPVAGAPAILSESGLR